MRKLSILYVFVLLLFVINVHGAQQPVAIGTSPNDNTGDPLRTAFTKLNANDLELYGKFPVSVANGGTGATTLTGVLKGNGTGALTAATAANIITLWTGSCSITVPLRGDGSCGTLPITAITGLPAFPVGAIVGTTDTQTLTNKTITAPAGILKGDVGLGNVENTALSTWAGSANLATLGTISAGTWNGTVVGTPFGGTGSATTSGARTNLGLAIGSNVEAWNANLDAFAGKVAPTGTVVGTNDAQTLTNKTLVAPALGIPSALDLANATNLQAAAIPNTAVTAGNYGDATHVGSFTVGADGRLTAANAVTITGTAPTGSAGGDLSGSYPNPAIASGTVTDDKASLLVKPSATVVATTNQTLSGLPTIDSIATADGSIILNTAQTTGSQNGYWVAHSGAWTRPTWYASGSTTQAMQFITSLVRVGTLYQGTTWRQTAAAPITIDTTATTWAETPLALNATSVTSALPVGNGGTGTASTLTGIMRGSSSAMTAAELSGDVTTSGSNATTVIRINGTTLSGLATGLVKNTTGTGVPSIAVASDVTALAPGAALQDKQIFTSSGTWTKPAGSPVSTRIICIGAGGGGGGGADLASGTGMSGGAGGGSGGLIDALMDTSSLGATETVTLGSGGSAGTAGVTSAGGTGGVGGNTTFGGWITAYGGGGGAGGQSGAVSGGGGSGGTNSVGGSGVTSTNGSAGSGAGGYSAAGNAGAIYGGGGRQGQNGLVGITAIGTAMGPSGGGSGGGIATTPVALAGGNGGANIAFQTGAAGGAANTAGSVGITPTGFLLGGGGGGGGGSSTSGAAGAGGAGTRGGGGGGGGAALTVTATAGAGGVGGGSYCAAITSF